MDKETIHKQIEILIETIIEQHDSLKAHPDYIAQIDMDLFLENIRDLYEFSIVLDKMNTKDRKLILGAETVGESPRMKSTELTRRSFLKTTALASAALGMPSILSSQEGLPPSNRLNIALCGVGGQGRSAVESLKGENFVAFCDVD